MKTIEEIQSELRSLAHELEQLKESRSAGEREIDFERLAIDGSHKPITPHPLGKFDNYAQKCYLTMLLTVARFEEDKLPASLLFAHRIAFGMGYLQKGGNLQSEYIAAQTLSYKQLDDLVEVFKGSDERLMLILECMLTAGIFDKGRKDAIDYIVQLSQLFDLEKDDMVFLSNMAAVILTQDLNAYKCDMRNKYDVFNCYLNSFDLKVDIVMEGAMALYDKESTMENKNNNVTLTPEILDNIEKIFDEADIMGLNAALITHGDVERSEFSENTLTKADEIAPLVDKILDSNTRYHKTLTNDIVYISYIYEKYQNRYGLVDVDFIASHYSEISDKLTIPRWADKYFKYKMANNLSGNIFCRDELLTTSGIEKILSQIVNKNFVLLVKAEEVQPNCPVGVEAHPLTPFPLIDKKYNDAWERFRESDNAEAEEFIK